MVGSMFKVNSYDKNANTEFKSNVIFHGLKYFLWSETINVDYLRL